VRYAETDQMAWSTIRITWCGWSGAGGVLPGGGFNYRDMEEEDGVLLAVVEAQCRYLHPARYDDEVIVSTQVRKAGQRGCSSATKCAGRDGRLLATENQTLFCDGTSNPPGCRRSAMHSSGYEGPNVPPRAPGGKTSYCCLGAAFLTGWWTGGGGPASR